MKSFASSKTHKKCVSYVNKWPDVTLEVNESNYSSKRIKTYIYYEPTESFRIASELLLYEIRYA